MVGRHIAVPRAAIRYYERRDQYEWSMLTGLSECSGSVQEFTICAFDNHHYWPFLFRVPPLRQREIVLNRVIGGSFQLRWFGPVNGGRGCATQYQQPAQQAREQH